MKKIYLVDETLNEFAGRRGRPRVGGSGSGRAYDDRDEYDSAESGPSGIENVDIDDDVTSYATQNQIQKRVNHELLSPEFNRASIRFRTADGEDEGIPMAKMKDAFLLKLNDGGMKKVKTSDMIL